LAAITAVHIASLLVANAKASVDYSAVELLVWYLI